MRQATEEQKQQANQKRAKFRILWRKVAAMSDEDRAHLAESMPIVTVEGHALSIHNECLIAFQSVAQRPVTVVGGFRQWQKQGRSVKKGEHGFMIWIPKMQKKEQPTQEPIQAETQEPSSSETVEAFLIGYVFDISQTQEETQ